MGSFAAWEGVGSVARRSREETGMGEQGDRGIWSARGRRTVGTDREHGRARRAIAMFVTAGALASSVVLVAASPAPAAGAACTTAELKPSLRELMVGQGLPSYSS